jgi:hypothetical protein
MRVSQAVVAQVKGGQVEAAVAAAIEAAGLVRRHGGDVHFFMTGVAGEQVNSTVFSMEYESPEALGAAFDAMAEDAELQALSMRLSGPDSPSEITSISMAMEVPLGRDPKQGQGGILEVHTGKPNPGRMEEAVAQAAEVCEFVEANGALNARLLQLTYAGMASGMTAFTWEVENMQAQARLGSAWFSDAGLALQAKMMGANPASTAISSALYNRIPL